MRVARSDGGQHGLLVGVRGEIEANVDVVGERDEADLEAVRRPVGTDRQRLDHGADEQHSLIKVPAGNTARRVHGEHDIHWAGI